MTVPGIASVFAVTIPVTLTPDEVTVKTPTLSTLVSTLAATVLTFVFTVAICVESIPVNDEPSPYALVRKNLEGLISRNVYYKLIDMAEEVNGYYGIYSSGNFFRLN